MAPAGVCRALIRVVIREGPCTRCGKCIAHCPYDAISGDEEIGFTINDEQCNRCGICLEGCEEFAIAIE